MILEHIKRILPQNNRQVVVGVSGGPDSLCLVDGLSRLAYPAMVAHFNHHLRPEAGEEARHVRDVAVSRGLDLLLGEGDVRGCAREHSLSLEEAARNLRYQFLFEEAHRLGAGAVVVGHNANDQVETILMNLLRGSGLAGLSGMSPYSLPNPWSETIPLVRPLLGVWREDILAYCQRQNLTPVHDPSNLDTTFFRNRVRNEFLPLLEDYRPGVQRRLWQTAHILAGDQEALQQYVDRLWDDSVTEPAPGCVAFDRKGFLNLPKGVQRRLVRRAFHHLRPAFTEVSFEIVEKTRQFLEHPPRSKEANLAGKVRMILVGKRAYLATWEAEIPLGAWPQMPGESSRLALPVPGRVNLPSGWRLRAEYAVDVSVLYKGTLQDATSIQAVNGHNLPQNVGRNGISVQNDVLPSDLPNRPTEGCERLLHQAYLDAGKIRAPLLIRPRQAGEKFAPLGMEGASMKVADFMVNEKIPRQARPKWPLVVSQGEVVWVPGYRLAHAARVTENTEKILLLTLEQG